MTTTVSTGIKSKLKPIHRQDGWPIKMTVRQWYRSNEVMFEDAKNLKNSYCLKYENLVQYPEKAITQIMNFIAQAYNDNINKNWSINEKQEPISNMNSQSISTSSSLKIGRIEKIVHHYLIKFANSGC